MRITETAPADITGIRGLLAEVGLPFDDIREPGKVRFLMAHDDDDEIIGAVGVEVYGKYGLLRSLVVKTHKRNHGLGARLTLNIESRSISQGIHTLYLLTGSAEKFFTAQGYQRLERTLVPEEIAATAEFRFLCPATAVCMYKHLDKANTQGNTR